MKKPATKKPATRKGLDALPQIAAPTNPNDDNGEKRFISQFSPQRTAPADLEAILVQRQDLLTQTVAKLRESLLGGSKHYFMFLGPRGMGKTHLLSLIAHRLLQMPELAPVMRLAWLNEDETSSSFLKLLLRIYRDLAQRYPSEFPITELDAIYPLSPDQARVALGKVLLKKLAGKQILLLIENCDSLFTQMQEPELRNWRSFIQTNPVFAIAASAQALFDGISKRTETFFGFFDTQALTPLNANEARELLINIADLNGQSKLSEYLRSARGKARVLAIHHLAGGNPRLYVILSALITPENLDELVRPFEQMVDQQLTPYYQERMRWLSPQQQEIVQALCKASKPINVNALAQVLFAPHSSITSQLKKLREMGYVIGHEKGREVLYELAEPLMRLSWQVKESSDARPLALLVDFLRIWYERDELELNMTQLSAEDRSRCYLENALALMQDGMPNLRHEIWRGMGENLTAIDDDALDGLIELAFETRNELDIGRAWLTSRKKGNRSDQLERVHRLIIDVDKSKLDAEPDFVLLIAMTLRFGEEPLFGLLASNSDDAFHFLKRLTKPIKLDEDRVVAGTRGLVLSSIAAQLVRLQRADSPLLISELVEGFRKYRLMNVFGILMFGALVLFVKKHWSEAQLWYDSWFEKWNETSIFKPIITTAIEYLKFQDENVLLELHLEERTILRQILGLDQK